MSKEILLILLFLWIWAVFANAQSKTWLKNCNSSCGGVNIPYPFGVGDGCYRDKGFEIICNYTYNTPRPFLGSIGKEVVEIFNDHRVRIKSVDGSFKCYDKSAEGQSRGVGDRIIDLRRGPFTFSNTQNKLFAVGCDVIAYISDSDGKKYRSACVSLCPNDDIDISNRSCSGIGFGCCQMSIPKGLKVFNVSLDTIRIQSLSEQTRSGCIYATLTDSFSSMGNVSSTTTIQMINTTLQRAYNTKTVVLDWAIGNVTCEEASRSNITYACKWRHSKCVNHTNGPGYRCKCERGFMGNPYMEGGCQGPPDIDECEGSNKCLNKSSCVNLEGGYHCTHYDHPKGNRVGNIFIGVSASAGILALVAVGFWLYREYIRSKHIKLKQKFYKRNGGLLLEQQVCSSEGSIEKTKIFVTEDLRKATDNFNEGRILGRGGSGTVYKGMLSDGRIVAIKKSKVVDESQIGQFINELVILSQINHRSIVKLFGCCVETEVPLLAYEFISNGTLSYHLHDEEHKSSISWEDRLRIAIEVAGALSYLHSSVSTPIFHRDVKSSNILLDESYRAKISDFGISRSVPYEQTHLTTLVQGTFGYLDPEYFHSSHFTDKSDVYSFGVVLVELLTGEKPTSFGRSEEEKNLVMHFVSSVKENRLSEILETRVLNEGGKEELMVVAKLAKRCLKLVGKKRPTMKEVSTKLEGLRKFPGEETDQKNSQETRYWLYDSFRCFPSDLESEDTKMMPCG